MRLPRNDLHHLSAVAHQGKHLLFGLDSNRAIHYCVKHDVPRETTAGYMLTAEALTDLRTRPDILSRLDGLANRSFAEADALLDAAAAALGKDVAHRYAPELLRLARQVVVSHWYEWQTLPLPHDEADDSVAAYERDEQLGGLVTAVYRSHKDSAFAPVQAVSDGTYLHIFRQSVRGTLLVDRFVLDGEANRLSRALEVRFKRSRKKHTPLRGAGGQELDSRDFRDSNGAFFLEPSQELHLVDKLEAGRFAVALVPTHEHDRPLWHIVAWDAEARRLRITTLRRTEEALFDLRDYTIVEGDGNERTARQIPGIRRHTLDLRDATDAPLALSGPLTAAVHELQREIEGDDGERQLVKVGRRLLLAAVTAAEGKLAALSFGLHRDGSLAPVELARDDRLLRERTVDLRLPSDVLDQLATCGGGRREPPPPPPRRGLTFAGDDHRVESRGPVALADGSFTIELWARRRAPGRTEVVASQGEDSHDRGLHLGFHGDRFRFGFHDNDLATAQDDAIGEWHHWACVVEKGGPRRIFRDGVQVAEDRPPTPYRGEGPLILGKAPWGQPFAGELADVRVWRKARNEAEIRALMDLRLSGNELGLVAHWPLEAIVDGVARNTVPRGQDALVHGAARVARTLSRDLADGVTPATSYRNDLLVAVAERSTYIESLELRTDGESGALDFVFWGETARGVATPPVRVPAQLEALADGWRRATARFTAGVGMTRLRALEFSAPEGAWRRLELRDHRLELLRDTVTLASHVDVIRLAELAPEFGALEKIQGDLDALERQESELVRRLRWLEATLASDAAARAQAVARVRGEVDALTAELQRRQDARSTCERSLTYGGSLALRANNGKNDRYLRVDDIHVDARSDRWGPWETFTVQNAASPDSQGLVCYGDRIALKAYTGKYLIADNPTWGQTHYYWVTAVYPEIGAYEQWLILHPTDPAASGPVPRGGPVALKSCRSDRGPKFMMTGTAGLWWQKTWCEHDTVQPDAHFVAVHVADGPAVELARQRFAEVEQGLQRRRQELAIAERLAGDALRDRAQVLREQTQALSELQGVQTRLSGAVTDHVASARRVADAAMTMPPVTPEGRPLSVQGALLGFARTRGRPTALASLEGALLLHFPGVDGRLRRCSYDAVQERWQVDANPSCLRFNGTGGVRIPHSPTFSTATYTIELWFRWHGRDGAIEFLTAKGYEELEIHVGPLPGGLRFIPAPGIYIDTAAHAFTPGEWVHLACVYTGEARTAEIYLDGLPATSRRAGTLPTRPATAAPILLGVRSDGGHPFSGQMSELRLWSVALTPDEIVAQMHHALTGHEPGLAGYWPLGDGPGDTARDLSAGEHHATVDGPRPYPSTAPMGRSSAGTVACLTFEHAGSVEIPHHPTYASSSFTAELWFRWTGGNKVEFLLGKGLEELEIHTGGDCPAGLRFIPAPGIYIDTAADLLVPGQWAHVACVFTGAATSAEVYLNGVAVTRQRADRGLARSTSAAPLRLGARFGGSSPFGGGISEVRLWNVARTQSEIQSRMYEPLTGREPNLVGYWPLRDGQGEQAQDLSPAANHGRISGPRFFLLNAPRERPPVGLLAPDTLLAGEYDSLEDDGNQRLAFLRRFLAWPISGGVEVAMGQRVDSLEMRWLGNAQMNPTLVGYIEGAPPVPSENLTVDESYDGASTVEFKITEETASTFTHDLSVGGSASVEAALGGSLALSFGPAVLTTSVEGSLQLLGKLGLATSFIHQYSRSGTSTVTTSETLALKGEREKVARFPTLGPRFVPKNVGYATVVSTLADVFVLRLRGSRRMVSYRLAPVKDVPPDVNVVTFLINPAYTLNGSLDGQVGSQAADARFHGHVPAARAQYGAEVEASYFRLREAYALKDAIDRSNRSAEAIAVNLKSDLLDGLDRGDDTRGLPTRNQAELERQTTQKATATTEAAAAAMKKPPVARQIEQVIDDTPKGNIVNTYVWDGDGGLRVQTQSFATSWQNVFGGSLNLDVGIGFNLHFRAFVAGDFTAMLGFNLTETLTNATSTSRAIELNVGVRCESRGVTDNQDRPLCPGEKVDRYRFMSFALQPATAHFTDFFSRVVDPEWLRSNDEEARVLRQIDQGKPNKTWRVLHRVTYVERPTRTDDGEG